MDFYELKNKYFSLVRKKMINDYKMGNIDFMESEELLDHIIERSGVYQDHGKSDDESIASAFRDFHGRLLALRPLTLGYTVGASYDGQSTIPGAEYVSVFRGLVGTEFADESMADKVCGTRWSEALSASLRFRMGYMWIQRRIEKSLKNTSIL